MEQTETTNCNYIVKTKDGERKCKNKAKNGEQFCYKHRNNENKQKESETIEILRLPEPRKEINESRKFSFDILPQSNDSDIDKLDYDEFIEEERQNEKQQNEKQLQINKYYREIPFLESE